MPTSGGSSSAKHASWRGLPKQPGSSHWSSTLLGALMALLCLTLFGVLLWLIVVPFFSHRLATHVVAITPGEFDNWTVPPILFADEDVQPLAQVDQLTVHDLKGLFDSRMIDSLPARLQTVLAERPDVLIVYAIAQGVSREDTAYLLCTDFDPVSFTDDVTRRPQSAYPVRDLLNLLGDLDVSAKLLVLDCGNLVIDPRMGLVVNEFPYLLTEAVAEQTDPRLWVMCSHSVGEASHALAHRRGSVFGRSVVSGLSGHADAGNPRHQSGSVTLWELYRYVTAQCQLSTHGRQTPLLMRAGQSKTSLDEDARQLALVKVPVHTAPAEDEPKPSPPSDPSREPPASEADVQEGPVADTTAAPVDEAAAEGESDGKPVDEAAAESESDRKPTADDEEGRDET